jgi:nitrous oxidase accessory protein NosD
METANSSGEGRPGSVERTKAAVAPRVGLEITESVRIRAGRHLLWNSSDDPYAATITIRGDDLVVDFAGAELRGTTEETPPDQRRGAAIRVEGRNVTIQNVRIRGYKVGLIARGAHGLKVLNSDFSYNWKQHLKSTIEREDLGDWMSYHRNEDDEWLRYGAGIYLRECDGVEVRNVRVTGGQCGLMLMECRHGLIWNNDFSFLSGIGIGLYRSSDNRIMHNKLDWCVRGYSHGVYNRGQDSAAILVYEQSNRNTFAYNSGTHSGDGFFLWAGQTTMDTGRGGCNDNLVYGNDFSHAPTNGIESTFSRNSFINNLIRECWHGVWGGYSYGSVFEHNFFADNEVGIAIEHGQSNTIRGNFFRREKKAIELWQGAKLDPDWGYPRYRDTRSRDYMIRDNLVDRAAIAIDLRDTAAVAVTGNRFGRASRVLALRGDVGGLRFEGNRLDGIAEGRIGIRADGSNVRAEQPDPGRPADWSPFARGERLPEWVARRRPEPLEGGIDPFLPAGAPRGRRTIMVDEWGPYDFRSPRLWPEPPRARGAGDVRRFRLLGPPGRWRLIGAAGVDRIAPASGTVPGTLTIALPSGRPVEVSLELEYVGEATVDALGNLTKAGAPVRFGYRGACAPSRVR